MRKEKRVPAVCKKELHNPALFQPALPLFHIQDKNIGVPWSNATPLQNHMRPLLWLNCHSPRIQVKTSSPKLGVKWNAFSMRFEEKNSFQFHGKIFKPIPSFASVEVPHFRSKRLWLKQASDRSDFSSTTKCRTRSLAQSYGFAISVENQMPSGNEMTRSFISRHLANRSFLQVSCSS